MKYKTGISLLLKSSLFVFTILLIIIIMPHIQKQNDASENMPANEIGGTIVLTFTAPATNIFNYTEITFKNKTPIYFSEDYDINKTLNFIEENEIISNLILTTNITKIIFGLDQCSLFAGGCYNIQTRDLSIDLGTDNEFWPHAFTHELAHAYYFNKLSDERISEWTKLYEKEMNHNTYEAYTFSLDSKSFKRIKGMDDNHACSAPRDYACKDNEEYYAEYFAAYFTGKRTCGRQEEELIRQDIIDLIGHDLKTPILINTKEGGCTPWKVI